MQDLPLTLPSGAPLVAHDTLGSTNAEALRLQASGEAGPLWIVAERQSAGRGRSGRSWESPSGNLHASLLQTFACTPADAAQLSLVAAVALHNAAAAALPPDTARWLRLKWPNDLLVGTAKAGGILVESVALAGGRGLAAVIGIGVNMATHPADLDRPATDLAAHGARLGPRELLALIDRELADALAVWNDGRGFALIRTAWVDRAGPIGEPLSVHATEKRVEGTFAGLDGDGALLLSDADGTIRRISYGDVTLAE